MSANIPNPYVGLRPFEMEEDLLFFGRDKQVLELLQRLHTHPFLAVVGGSGSGKSSLIRAGLIPALKGGYLVEDSSKWKIAVMKPGQNPMYNFAEALLRQVDPNVSSDQINKFLTTIKKEGIKAIIEKLSPLKETQRFNFFMLVDQFEELFRYQLKAGSSDQITEAIDFVNTILDLTSQKRFPFYIVLTMRSDFIGDCAQFHGLPEALNTCQYLVPRLNREEMKRVIEGPAKLYGKKFSPALTSKLLNDTTKVRDELPLLQHALMRIWDYEVEIDDSGELDLRDYKKIGTIHSALSQHADMALYGGDMGEKEVSMTKEDVELTKTIFKALTEIDESGRKIRRPVLMSELKALTGADENSIMAILDRFIRNKRSFVYLQDVGDTDDKLIDISHESLIRQWHTLGHWVDEEAESAANYLQLTEAARLHAEARKDYLVGSELQLTLDWWEKFKPTKAWANRYEDGRYDLGSSKLSTYEVNKAYLNLSVNERDLINEIERKRQRKQKNTTHAVIGLLVLIIVAGVSIWGVTWHNTQTRELQDKAEFLSASDPTAAMWLASEAMSRSDHWFYHRFYDEKQESDIKNTAQMIYKNEAFYIRSIDVASEVSYVVYAPSGQTFLTTSRDSLALWDLEGKSVHKLIGHSGSKIDYAFFTSGGKTIYTVSADNSVHLFNLDGNLIGTSHKLNAFMSIAFAPDRKSILIGANDKIGYLLDLDGNVISETSKNPGAITAVAFAPNGESILTISSSFDSSDKGSILHLWNLEGNLIREFEVGQNNITSVAFAPDGQSILTASKDDTIVTLWDLEGKWIHDFSGHEGIIYSIAFSSDGQTILTGSGDNTARLWDLDGILLKEFKGHQSGVTSVAFGPDDATILTGSRDGTAKIWPLNTTLLKEIRAPQATVTAVDIAPDGQSILTWGHGDSGSLGYIQNLENSMIYKNSKHPGLVTAVDIAQDGQHFLTGSWDTDGIIARLWDLQGNLISAPIVTDVSEIANVVEFSKDGKTFLVGSRDKSNNYVRICDLNNNVISEFEIPDCGFKDITFSPDGKFVLVGCEDNSALLLDVKEQSKRSFSGHLDEVTSVAFAPDGKSILTGSRDNTAIHWPLDDDDDSEITTFRGHYNTVSAVAFSPDSTKILTGSHDKKVILWDKKGNALQQFKGHSKAVIEVAFSPDMKTILTAAEDNTVRLWKIAQPLEDFLKTDWGQPLTDDQKTDLGID